MIVLLEHGDRRQVALQKRYLLGQVSTGRALSSGSFIELAYRRISFQPRNPVQEKDSIHLIGFVLSDSG
jgi:hypothetical protein